MPHGDIRDDWKLQAIERKADEASSRLHELDTLRSNVDSLEHTNRELSTSINDLRAELQTLKDNLRQALEY